MEVSVGCLLTQIRFTLWQQSLPISFGAAFSHSLHFDEGYNIWRDCWLVFVMRYKHTCFRYKHNNVQTFALYWLLRRFCLGPMKWPFIQWEATLWSTNEHSRRENNQVEIENWYGWGWDKWLTVFVWWNRMFVLNLWNLCEIMLKFFQNELRNFAKIFNWWGIFLEMNNF